MLLPHFTTHFTATSLQTAAFSASNLEKRHKQAAPNPFHSPFHYLPHVGYKVISLKLERRYDSVSTSFQNRFAPLIYIAPVKGLRIENREKGIKNKENSGRFCFVLVGHSSLNGGIGGSDSNGMTQQQCKGVKPCCPNSRHKQASPKRTLRAEKHSKQSDRCQE